MFRNLHVICFILATGQIFSLKGGGHKYIYSNRCKSTCDNQRK